MEKQLLNVVFNDRDSFSLVQQYVNLKLYTREFGILYEYIKAYYDRDQNARSVDYTVLRELIASQTTNEKHFDRFINYLDEALSGDVSSSNVKEVVLNMKKRELGQELALAISNERDHEKLLEDYGNIMRYASLEEMTDKGVEVFDDPNLDELLAHENDPSDRLIVYPLSLNERLEGGLRGSDCMCIIARPEMGKTGAILTLACGFAKQGKKGIVFNNEERVERLRMRALACCTGMTFAEIRANPQAAKDIAEQMGFHNIIFIGLSPGTPQQIDYYVEKYEATWFIVDQIRNLLVKSDNKTNQLEEAAKSVRNIGKKRNAVSIYVTQAGDSAEGKAVLNMGDVDSSNTGIPGACDVLLGIGATEEQKKQGIRVLSLSKNKIGGIHDDWPVRFNQWISKYVSIKDRG